MNKNQNSDGMQPRLPDDEPTKSAYEGLIV